MLESIKTLIAANKISSVPRMIKNRPELLKFVEDSWDFSFAASISQKLHWLINQTSPVCIHGEEKYFINFSRGYSETSNKCKECKTDLKNLQNDRRKLSVQAKYGVDSIAQLESVKNAKILTSMAKYGVEHHTQTPNHYQKRKATLLERYGVEHQMHLDTVKQQIKKTNIARFGVENPAQASNVQHKIRKTINEKYGGSIFNDPGIRAKHLKGVQDSLPVSHYGLTGISAEAKAIIYDPIAFTEFASGKSRIRIAQELNVSQNLVNVKIREYAIPEFLDEYRSSYEKEFVEFFAGHNISRSDRSLIKPYEIDIVFPDAKIGVELNGNYFHSEDYRDSKYHLHKTQLADNAGISLYHFFEDEWVYKQPICLSMIMQRLGESKTTGARKTQLAEVSPQQAQEFLIENHIQGSVRASVNIGLFLDDQLMCLMTFGKIRVALGSQSAGFEMLRFANKIGTSVIGGASRCFNYFVQTYNADYIVSYANRRYSRGALYEKLGFTFAHNTPPSYWYLDPKNLLQRYHRFTFRKDVLVKSGFDSAKTEKQIMTERGFRRIWDCGNTKWEWRKP